jgi:hypothetical protein
MKVIWKGKATMSDENKLNDVKPNDDNNAELDKGEMTENELDNVAGGGGGKGGQIEIHSWSLLLPAVKTAGDGSV